MAKKLNGHPQIYFTNGENKFIRHENWPPGIPVPLAYPARLAQQALESIPPVPATYDEREAHNRFWRPANRLRESGMKIGGTMDLKDVPIDDLLADISSHVSKELSPIDKWLKDEGYYPGSTRVLAAELHRRYVAWRAQQPNIADRIEDVRRFGMVLRGKFKFGKLNVGNCYYISRERLSVLDPMLILAPHGNPAPPTPGGAAVSKAKKTK